MYKIIYFGLFLSILLSILGLFFKLILNSSNPIYYLNKLKKVTFIPKLVIKSQILYYHLFCNIKFKRLYFYIILGISVCIQFFSVIFRATLLKDYIYADIITTPKMYIIILIIISLNTIAKSFSNLGQLLAKGNFFDALLALHFFDTIETIPYWKKDIDLLKSISFSRKQQNNKK